MSITSRSSKRGLPIIGRLGMALGFLALMGTLATPFGNRAKLWGYGTSLEILHWAFYIGIAALLVSLIALYRCRPGAGHRGFALMLVSVLVLATALAVPAYWGYQKSRLPPIQDITTDTEEPPEFWSAPTSRAYGGEAVAAMQRKAYPDIRPLQLDNPPEQVFEAAVALVRERGWRLWDPDPEEGRIEASITTFWFGFEDDVAIRIREAEGGKTRVDMRSTSRFGGGGDGGTNARRIRDFLADLKDRL